MKKILLLLVIMLTVPALFAQYDYQRGTRAKPAPEGSRATPVTGGTRAKPAPEGSRATPVTGGTRAKPAPEGSRARSITSGTRATPANGEKKNPKPHYEVLPKIVNDTTIEQKVGEASSEAPAADKKKENPIEVASGPCENAPTVTFDEKTFRLDCELPRDYDPLIFNYYRYYKQGSKFEDANIRVEWDPNYLKLNALGKSNRDGDIEAYREGDYTKNPGYQILRLSNGNVIMSYASDDRYDNVVIYRTFNLKNNQGGNIHLHIYGSNVVPKDIRGNRDKWEEWRAEMVDEAVAWPIPTPYK